MTILRKAPLFLFALVFAIVVGAGETRSVPVFLIHTRQLTYLQDHTK